MKLNHLWLEVKNKATKLGFSDIQVTDCDLSRYITHYNNWIKNNYHGSMNYMTTHGEKRYEPEKLIPDTQRVIIVAVPYLTKQYEFKNIKKELDEVTDKAIISRYAWGRDYHKVIRKKLNQLAQFITEIYSSHQYRAFTDSAPVLEKPLAEKAGLGIIGKHSNLLNKQGSWFFIGEIYSNIPFKINKKIESEDLCGKCRACINICPTNAIIKDKVVDARKCISYLTIENKDEIPLEFRKQIGSRIYGCDDCQLICPWNRYAKLTTIDDFKTRHSLDNLTLLELFNWNEQTFLKNTEGSAIRRIGYLQWIRNLAIGLGNAPKNNEILDALYKKRNEVKNEMVLEHINWAITEQL